VKVSHISSEAAAAQYHVRAAIEMLQMSLCASHKGNIEALIGNAQLHLTEAVEALGGWKNDRELCDV